MIIRFPLWLKVVLVIVGFEVGFSLLLLFLMSLVGDFDFSRLFNL